jgi:hypothetical protein
VRTIRNTQIHCVDRIQVDHTKGRDCTGQWSEVGAKYLQRGERQGGCCTWRRKQDSMTNRCQLSEQKKTDVRETSRYIYKCVEKKKLWKCREVNSVTTPCMVGNFCVTSVRRDALNVWINEGAQCSGYVYKFCSPKRKGKKKIPPELI